MSGLSDLLAELCPDGVDFRALGELGEVFRGRRFVKSDYVEEGIGAIHYGQLYTDFDTMAAKVVTRVRQDLRPSLRFVKSGDVVVAEVGETVEDVGKAVAWLGDEEVAIHDGCYGLRHDMNPVFIAYYLQTPAFHRDKARHVARAKVKRLSLGGLKQIRIPVPPREVQDEVVRILDLFAAHQAGLEEQLQVERHARRRQYEHHRASLLQFGTDVEWSTLGEQVDVRDRDRRPITRSKRVSGPIPYYGANGVQDWVADYIFDGTYLLMGEDGSVVNSDGSPVLNWTTGKIWVNNHAHVLAERARGLSLRFLFHYLHVTDVRQFAQGAPPKITQANMRSIPVPVPPPAVQARVVELLDRYVSAVDDLTASLAAESHARRRQYEHYRAHLLSFKEAA